MSKAEKKGNRRLCMLVGLAAALFVVGLTTAGLLVVSYTILAL